MKIGKRIYFESPQERKKFTDLLKGASDTIQMAQIISEAFGKEFVEAMEIAGVYNEFMRKEGE